MVQKNILKITALAAALALVGCGGGGSKGYFDSSSNSGGGGSVTAGLAISDIQLLDLSDNETQTITPEGVMAKVKILDSYNQPISGSIVTFTGEGVEFGTTNGSVLTNADGEAIIFVKPIDATVTGAYQLSASVVSGDLSASSKPFSFTFQSMNIVLADINAGSLNVESGGSTNITLKTLDAMTQQFKNNVAVNFTTSCGSFVQPTVLSSNQGNVTATYSAVDAEGKLCTGNQMITVRTGDSLAQHSITVNVAELRANLVSYDVAASQGNLVIRGSGSAASGQAVFTIYANGAPAANQEVQIDLVRGPSDLNFIALGNRESRIIKSDSEGKVFVTLYPGDIPGPVEIKAQLVKDSSIVALSKNIAVATGRVTQTGLSLSVSKNALQGRMDGDSASVTARMVDRLGNPVPNGTVISFITEGGAITPNCATVDGQCSVTLSTQDPRPADNRVTVLAYAEGDKAYQDVNGDNIYTAGVDKIISNIGDFYRDDNENGKHDVGEFVYKRGASGTNCDMTAQPNIQSTCDNELDGVIRQSLTFAFSDDTPTFYKATRSNSSVSFQVFGNTLLSVPMPTGTSVAAEAEDNTKDNELSCSAELATGPESVPSVFNLLKPSTFVQSTQTYYEYILKECAPGDVVTITVTSPSGKISRIRL